jgi:hypothetical protein
MRFAKSIQVGILLALCFGLPARGANGCSEGAQYAWLSSCSWALFEIRRTETPQPKGPYESTGNVLFAAEANLSDELVEACYKLVAEPERLPAKPFMSIRPLLADPCTWDEHLQWLQSCENDALALPGQTRADLLARFSQDGGFSSFSDEAFVHRRCGLLKASVSFSLTVAGEESPSDVVETVSVYVDALIFD